MSITLFGNAKNAAHVAGRKRKPKKEKVKKPLKTLAIWLTVLLVLEGLYFFCAYTTNEFVSHWRTVYINTALSTMRHRWLATALLPKDVVQEVIDYNTAISQQASGKTSSWEKKNDDEVVVKPNVRGLDADIQHVDEMTEEEREALYRDAFYELYWELDQDSMEAYLAEHPDTLANGWDNIYINEAGLDDDGTTIRTVFDEQVLAIDWSVGIGRYGQNVGDIAERTGGLLAMTGSGFIDEDSMGNQGAGNGGILAGYAMCNGVAAQGRPSRNVDWHSFVRLELHKDNLMYIRSIDDPVSEDCTDAVEFEPAMIVDGESLVSNWWVELNPRTAIGQSDKYEVLMLAIEGRNPAAGILGTDINVCAEILQLHNCEQAIALDGGASTIMWYDGEYITRCANLSLSKGRTLPNAIVYHRADYEGLK